MGHCRAGEVSRVRTNLLQNVQRCYSRLRHYGRGYLPKGTTVPTIQDGIQNISVFIILKKPLLILLSGEELGEGA